MAARIEYPLPKIVELPRLSTSDLDPLLNEEIGVWDRDFHWDFRPSAGLLRRFVQMHSLYGYALLSGTDVVGYAYHVCEGRKGLIGDFFVSQRYASPANEMALLDATVQGLMRMSGIHRIESQLMLLSPSPQQVVPFDHLLARYDRLFMEAPRSAILRLEEQTPDIPVTFHVWEERFQEEIAHLVAAAYRGHVDSEINDQYRTIPGARHFLTNIIKYPGCGVFSAPASVVAVDGRSGRVCGVCLASSVSPTSGHVTQLCILPAIRGGKLGYELLRQTCSKLIASGLDRVSLTVTASNRDAIRLYESAGFEAQVNFPALVWEDF